MVRINYKFYDAKIRFIYGTKKIVVSVLIIWE